MRSLPELQALAKEHDIDPEGKSREELMDNLRAVTGTFDPGLQIDPMKAKDLKNHISWGTENPFTGIASYLNDKYVVEPKLDGARIRMFLGTSANTLNTGRRSDVTFAYIERADNFPHLRDLVVPELAGTILDGEVMMPEGTRIEIKPGDFTKGPLNTIMSVLNTNPDLAVARQQQYGPATMHVFDVLAVKGEPVMHLPYTERRELLVSILERLDQAARENGQAFTNISLVPQYEASAAILKGLLDAGLEGGMIKLKTSQYVANPNVRSGGWFKVKRMSTGDFYIIGSNPGKGRNEGKVGSLKLAYRGYAGEDVYCADMRGFDDATMEMLTNPDTGEVKDEYLGRVVELMAQGRTKNERLRHPHFIRWRDDKKPEDCTREQLELFIEV